MNFYSATQQRTLENGINERKRAEEAMLESERMQGVLEMAGGGLPRDESAAYRHIRIFRFNFNAFVSE